MWQDSNSHLLILNENFIFVQCYCRAMFTLLPYCATLPLFFIPSNLSLHKKMKFSIKDFFSKSAQIRSFLRIWSHLMKKYLMENFIFCEVFFGS